ncbi:MAG: hypothetical protein D6806_06655 [Deltaproteobacteria bacterium]|nr:MAG: hypothetical protein D6806_06655 [Deltaproteobacteria bacterium]
MDESKQIAKLLEQGLADYGLGKLEDAVKSWQKVLELDPSNRRAKEYLEFVRSAWGPRPSVAETSPPPATGQEGQKSGSVFASRPPKAEQPPPASQDGSEFTKPKTDTTGWGNLFELSEEQKDQSQQESNHPSQEAGQETPALPPHPPIPPDASNVQEQQRLQASTVTDSQVDVADSSALAQSVQTPPPSQQNPRQQQSAAPGESPHRPAAGHDPAATNSESPPLSDPLDLVGQSPSTPEPQVSCAGEAELESLIKGAADLMELDDFSGALELIEKILQVAPDNQQALQWKSEAEQQLLAMYKSKLGDMNRVPQVRISKEEIIWLNLDHRAGYLLSLVDGRLTIDEIIAICGFPELQALKLLAELVQDNVIELG